jgi:hypothetical protein
VGRASILRRIERRIFSLVTRGLMGPYRGQQVAASGCRAQARGDEERFDFGPAAQGLLRKVKAFGDEDALRPTQRGVSPKGA